MGHSAGTVAPPQGRINVHAYRDRAATLGSPGASDALNNLGRFFCPDAEGVLCPGDARPFAFAFRAPKPGVWTERWRLETRPEALETGPRGRVVPLRGVAPRRMPPLPKHKT